MRASVLKVVAAVAVVVVAAVLGAASNLTQRQPVPTAPVEPACGYAVHPSQIVSYYVETPINTQNWTPVTIVAQVPGAGGFIVTGIVLTTGLRQPGMVELLENNGTKVKKVAYENSDYGIPGPGIPVRAGTRFTANLLALQNPDTARLLITGYQW